jgi:hypothetical protein
VAYACQELDQLPAGRTLPAGRAKPWGTAHAILAAGTQVRGPFMAINADDFYGRHAFASMASLLADPAQARPGEYAMVAFRLANTLSEHGTVARGVCQVDAGGTLRAVAEHTGLERAGGGIRELAADGSTLRFTGQERVSMNFWGFRPDVFARFEALFADFLAAHRDDPKAEFYIPTAVDALIRQGQARVRVLDTPDRWFGVTYREDKDAVVRRIQELVQAGAYPSSLWS